MKTDIEVEVESQDLAPQTALEAAQEHDVEWQYHGLTSDLNFPSEIKDGGPIVTGVSEVKE